MAVDTSQIDLKALIEREAGNSYKGPYGRAEKAAYKGPCPWCQGDDRFGIFMNAEQPHFYCGIHGGSGCGKGGDAIAFIREWKKLSFVEACQYLELPLDGTAYQGALQRKKAEPVRDIAPNTLWQKRGVALVEEARAFLHSGTETARRALGYLQKRGVADEAIDQWKLGYIAESRFELRADWGLADEPREDGTVKTKLFIPRGWLIPWLAYPDLWRLDIRRHPKDIEAAKQKEQPIGKYHKIVGSSEGLFNFGAIKENMPLIVTESPLDAIVGTQETTDFVWVATGSTGGARKDPRWCEAMSLAYPVLIAFDADRPGNNAFHHWKAKDFKPVRRRPWAHDINDMKLAGQDIQAWAMMGFETALELDVSARSL